MQARRPTWVGEGAAQYVPHILLGEAAKQAPPFVLASHRRYWGRVGLDSFWKGTRVWRRGLGMHMSYTLAFHLFRRISMEYPARVRVFVADARASDFGADAARAHFGKSLGELASLMLMEGDWEPRFAPSAAKVHRPHERAD